MNTWRGLAAAIDSIDADDFLTSPGGQTHRVRGEWKMRRGSEPAYTVTGTQYPAVVDGDFEPDPSLSGVGAVECSRTMTREEVRAAQTMDDIVVPTDSKVAALEVIGNSVPPRLAEHVAEDI